ncbi:MAG: hypothetical protein FWE05_05880 [Defluviitaleaceae bacterium]|nr:hypothetical protein [Defluviitaleaceae bacterium]
MTYYPVLLKPIHKKMIWGSESWAVSCRPNEMCIIENGAFAGEKFDAYIRRNPSRILGTDLKDSTRFPLLVKIINAQAQLSVQVHPNDDYAKLKGETDSGKNEAWYIIKPPTDGHLIIGLTPETTRETLYAAYKNGTVPQYLNRLKVKEGDIVNIPAGLIHGIASGTIIAEVQQNSNITYRLYDYDRTDDTGNTRELHIEDALAVTDFENKISKATAATGIVENEYFTLKKLTLSEAIQESTSLTSFIILICVSGSVMIKTSTDTVELSANRSVFLPASLGQYTIQPICSQATLLKAHAKSNK